MFFCYGVGDGEGLGATGCSDAGMLVGFGVSGDVCRWIAFHEFSIRLKTSVMRPEAVSGVPLYVCD